MHIPTMRGESERTPLPSRQLGVLFLFQFIKSFQFGVMWPMVPFMVADFLGSRASEKVLGYYVGALESSYFFAQLLACLPWGSLADSIGRRPVLLYTAFGSAFALLLFGFATSFWMALLSRIVAGAFDGSVGIIKTYVGEITDVSNRAQGFAVIAFAFGVASIVAPMLGGFLLDRWPAYPYALPALVGTSVGLLGFVAGLVHLPESPKFVANSQKHETQPLLDPSSSPPQPSLRSLIFRRQVLVASSIYGLICLAQVIFDEVLPIFCRASLGDAGLGFPAWKIGILLAIQGLAIAIYQPLVYPRVAQALGVLSSTRWSLLLLLPSFSVFPFVAHLAARTSPELLWPILALFMILRATLGCQAFTGVMILISNSSSSSSLGRVNGFAQTLASFSRSLGPLAGGSLWSAGQAFAFPYAPYILSGASLLIGVLATFAVDEALNRPYEGEEGEGEDDETL